MHAARKALKRARAALRLLRPALQPSVYERENRALRDAGRCLSPLRDAKSLVLAVDLLGSPRTRTTSRAAPELVLRQMLKQHLDEQRRAFADGTARRGCLDLVKSCRQHMHGNAPRRVEPSTLLAGLRKIYRQARKAFARASSERTPEALHEWRKQTKYLHAATGALSRAGVRPLSRLVKRCAGIASRLGDDHDLVALRNEIERVGMAKADADAILARIDKRRMKLQQHALTVGAHAFQKKPGQFAAGLSISRR